MGYSQIYRITVLIGTVMVGLSIFLGLYLPSVGEAVDYDEDVGIDITTFDVPIGYNDVEEDGQWWIDNDNLLLYDIGGTRYKIQLFEQKNDPEHDYSLILEEDPEKKENVSSTHGAGWNDIVDNNALLNTHYVWDNPRLGEKFYLSFEEFEETEEGGSRVKTSLRNYDLDETQENVTVAWISGTLSYGLKPMSEDIGFRDVVFGMFGFNIPLIPDSISLLISTIFYIALGFVVFTITLLALPWVG